ncbi:MAG: FMN-binding protein [Rhodothermales bacterium]|nr:FMN-binding protein [Rhodothermales bacterium]
MPEPDQHIDVGAPQGGSLRMVAVMGSVGLIASTILVATFQITTPFIEANRRAYLENAILDVIPGATTFAFFDIRDDTVVRADEPHGLYAGFDSSGALAGLAIESRGQGYQDVIRLLYGYSPDCECVVGMKVLESKETPGLGDKIEKDDTFRANFDALAVETDEANQSLLRTIEMVKSGEKNNPWEIEAITGATVSSRAITRIVGESAAGMIPLLRRNLDQLTEAG